MIARPAMQPSLRSDTCVVVRMQGEYDLVTSAGLADLLSRLPEGTRELVADLTDVTFMDCSALAALVQARTRFGSRLWLRDLPDLITRLLEATGLAHAFTVIRSPGRVAGSPAMSEQESSRQGSGEQVLPEQVLTEMLLIEQAKGVLVGLHRCTSAEASRRLEHAASARDLSVVDLARALMATVSGQDGFRCSAGLLTALIAVMAPRPDRIEVARSQQPGGRPDVPRRVDIPVADRPARGARHLFAFSLMILRIMLSSGKSSISVPRRAGNGAR